MRSRQEAFERHPAEADAAEAVMAVAASKTVRLFLARVQKACTARAITELPFAGARGQFITAAGDAWNLFTQGELSSWWTEAVSQELLAELANIWRQGYHNHTADMAGLDALPQYLASVKGRLSDSTKASITGDAFNMARNVLANGLAVGDSTKAIARNLATTFSWDPELSNWEAMKAHADAKLDAILDAVAPPDTQDAALRAARERAKYTSPDAVELIKQRNLAQSRLDAKKSTWESRATTIARTESTGALNAGAVNAFLTEGVKCVEWLATHRTVRLADDRTRLAHRLANGQKRPLGVPFLVGGEELFFPGDPTGSAGNVINCRCAIVGTDCD